MEVADVIKQTPLFAELSEADINQLSQSSRIETHQPGHVILREGRVGAAFYVLISGKVEVIKGMDGAAPVVISTLEAGDFFGEIAALKHGTRSATVQAVTEATCLVVRRLDLDSFIERYPILSAKVTSVLNERLEKLA